MEKIYIVDRFEELLIKNGDNNNFGYHFTINQNF